MDKEYPKIVQEQERSDAERTGVNLDLDSNKTEFKRNIGKAALRAAIIASAVLAFAPLAKSQKEKNPSDSSRPAIGNQAPWAEEPTIPLESPSSANPSEQKTYHSEKEYLQDQEKAEDNNKDMDESERKRIIEYGKQVHRYNEAIKQGLTPPPVPPRELVTVPRLNSPEPNPGPEPESPPHPLGPTPSPSPEIGPNYDNPPSSKAPFQE